MFKKKLISFLAIASFFAISSKAYSAGQGSLGATSSIGTKSISINIAKKVKITGLEDFNVADWDASQGDLIQDDSLCVYSNASGSGGYNVKADSSTGSSVFELASGTQRLPYSVGWTATGTGVFDSSIALTDGDATGLEVANAHTSKVDCGTDGDNATISIKIARSDLESMVGTDTAFTDTLTLTIRPI